MDNKKEAMVDYIWQKLGPTAYRSALKANPKQFRRIMSEAFAAEVPNEPWREQ